MKKYNKCCIGILKWQLFWEKEKNAKETIIVRQGKYIKNKKDFFYNIVKKFKMVSLSCKLCILY